MKEKRKRKESERSLAFGLVGCGSGLNCSSPENDDAVWYSWGVSPAAFRGRRG